MGIRWECRYPLTGLSSVWVSTDNEAIAAVAKAYGAQVHWRAPYTATDTASSLLAIREFLGYHPEVDYVAYVQTTSPMARPDFLQEACQKIYEGWDAVFSVQRLHKFTWKETTGDEVTEPLNFNPAKRPRRQEWGGMMIENGMFYFSKASIVMKDHYQTGRVTYIEIPPEYSIEIDAPFELHLAEQSIFFLEDEMVKQGCLKPIRKSKDSVAPCHVSAIVASKSNAPSEI
ncbi:unnamed protein product [Cyprideis torosa]|uniref:Uncharacterized protein n=1 Tax=Cyprideis torosa TaxID=163714 RepID=A0A7R8W7Z5_9CRUS|nr:unnamed protein product [Cyprideis torosa]CAG0886900.1 unnamed protein product [Cyprideis torosa]